MSVRGSVHKRVLNTTSTMTTKKLSASSACCDLLKERNMTSMVLQSFRSVALRRRFLGLTYRSIVLLYLKGLKTLSKRNVLKIENLKNDA